VTVQNCPDLSTGGVDERQKVFELLATGATVSAVARELGHSRVTIRDWRDSDEGQSYLRAAREKRAAAFEEAAEEGRRLLRENAVRAAQALVDDLAVPSRRAAAARDILDRVGVLRGESVTINRGRDLSNLTAEDIEKLLEIQAKAEGRGA
jgi:transposase-like protein